MVSHKRMLLVFIYTLCCLPQGLPECPNSYWNSHNILISVGSQPLREGGSYRCGHGTTLTCVYRNDNSIRGQSQVWWLKSSDTDPLENAPVKSDFTCSDMDYSPTSSGTYKCQYYDVPDSAFTVTITLLSSGSVSGCVDLHPPSSSSSPSTATSGLHTTVTATLTPTSTTRNTNHFKGTNNNNIYLFYYYYRQVLIL